MDGRPVHGRPHPARLGAVMSRIGYARVSTGDQDLAGQIARLEADGCERIFTDVASGKLTSRPQWDALLAYARRGDVIVCIRLDRIGRSVKNLLEVSARLGERGVDLRCLDQAIDTTSPAGRMTFTILAAVAEFERDLIRERTRDGLAAARARGRKGGRRPKLSHEKQALAVRLYDERGKDGKRAHTVAYIANMLECSRGTVYAAVEAASGNGAQR